MNTLSEATEGSAIRVGDYLARVTGAGRVSQKDRTDNLARLFDIIGALTLLMLFAPLLGCITLTYLCGGNSRILFAHKRIGRNGRSFPCLKFRTMVPDAEDRLAHILASDEHRRAEWLADRKMRDDPRVTRIGRFLRKSSFDELPQLINVLRGEMSLVGPRPIVSGEIPLYGRHIGSYCDVRPGLSGLWQVSGRNDVSYRRRVAYDVCYARSRSLGLYFSILMRTPACLILARGCY